MRRARVESNETRRRRRRNRKAVDGNANARRRKTGTCRLHNPERRHARPRKANRQCAERDTTSLNTNRSLAFVKLRAYARQIASLCLSPRRLPQFRHFPRRGAIHRAGETAAGSACQRFVRVFGACSKRFCARRAIGHRHQPGGFSGVKKYVPCILKYV